jgi:hypothetical protein
MANRIGRPTVKQPGDKKGRLTLICTETNLGRRGWRCKCDCGNDSFVRFDSLKSTNSCGCIRIEKGKQKKTHGMINTPAYNVWAGMKKRCLNEKNPNYYNYGGRGITVSSEWMNFENFFADMGHPEPGMQLDRIDNNAGYSKENCRWATPKQNARNKRTNVVHDGLTFAEAAEISGHSIQVIHWRITKLGMTIQEAMNTPKLRKRSK